MKKEMKITAKGLFLLERIIRSCPPRISNGGLGTKKMLFSLAKEKKDLFANDLLEKLQIKDFFGSVFSHFFGVAEELGVSKIDERFIVEYFSGEFHFSEITRKIEEGDIELMKYITPLFRHYVKITHLLMPVSIRGLVGNSFLVRYENGDMKFNILSLVPYKEDLPMFKKDTLVWMHLSSIVGIADKNLAEIALESQQRNASFWQACQKVSKIGIDTEALIQYNVWARDAFYLFQD